MASGSFALAEELFARGDAAFVAELRRVHDAERLGNFAARWLADPRPAARRLLIDYLSLALNVYRHEALVKRLFKGAEKARDDELMGVFLLAFDRCIRRARKEITLRKYDRLSSRAEAETRLREWESEGFTSDNGINEFLGRFNVYATKPAEIIVTPNNVMPRPKEWKGRNPRTGERITRVLAIPDHQIERLQKRFILFSLPTRRYLRRRAWRFTFANSARRIQSAAIELRRSPI